MNRCPVCTVCTDFSPSAHPRYQKCDRCAVQCLLPTPTEEDLSELYGQASYFQGGGEVGYLDYEGEAPNLRRTHRLRNRRLGLELRGKRILEVGCATGEYGAVVEGAEYVGLDPNSHALARARARGLRVVQGTVAALAGERFDGVAFFDVLEHLLDPHGFLGHLHDLVTPGGEIWFTTPDTRSLLARLSGRRWVSYKTPEHVVLYHHRALVDLLAAHGFGLRRSLWDLQWYSLSLVGKKLGRGGTHPLADRGVVLPNGNLLVRAVRG